MTNTEAKVYREALYQAHDVSTRDLKALSGGERGPMGLTPDGIKQTPEWKSAYHLERQAFERLRKHNAYMVKTFKKEMREERKAKFA